MSKIFPLGESALTIEFSNEISPETNDKVINLASYFGKNKFAGFVEVVPAYASLTIFYEVFTVRKHFPEFQTAFDSVKNLAENALRNFTEIKKEKSRVIEIPVRFDKEHALDLGFVAEINNLKPRDVIEIFTAQSYRVYMLGFLPGFAYLGEVDARIAAPRKLAPRLKVPKGSVGIAGRQTGIYPLSSPGGWQIIGATEVELFTPNAINPTFLQAGDLVKFYSEN
ncbi:MAG: 5-oxoprolinase subunit PxpB [Pyrinomonadaceae bacterium]|nr:5-oxoprolinase subunit PxpB [Pyrinomonadaceae bacterium]